MFYVYRRYSFVTSQKYVTHSIPTLDARREWVYIDAIVNGDNINESDMK